MKRNIDLLHEPILPALTRLALPIMATSLVQMAYNLTDMAWIGLVGADAVAAVGSASMYTWFSQGVSNLAKMGGQVKVAHALGRKDEQEAAEYAQGALQIGILFAVLFGIITVTCRKGLVGFFNMQDPEIIRQAEIYLAITCGLIIFSFLNAIFTGILTAAGDSKTPFLSNVIGLVMNIIFDPVLIFGWGPFPRLGVAGAAIATVGAQAVVTLVFLFAIRTDRIIFDKVHLLKRVSGRRLEQIVRIGFPSAVQTMIYSGISMILTSVVTRFGDTAVAVQRVGGQIESLSWMTADGFAAAINSFVGQNFGAGQYDRVKKGYWSAVKIMFVWGMFCTALLIFGAEPIFRLFIHEDAVVGDGIAYLQIIGISQMFMCEELLTVGALSGLGKTMQASIISVLLTSARIPMAYALAATPLGLSGVWWALSISSVAKGIVYVLYFMRLMPAMERERARRMAG